MFCMLHLRELESATGLHHLTPSASKCTYQQSNKYGHITRGRLLTLPSEMSRGFEEVVWGRIKPNVKR
ncbi:hypothetical protein EYF80_039991 [Liparis tanakae]|uniref:Uncharacterized protein n=1 Tax=Liparis tanakae TaxID=230148 RepID=A0A4Z2G8H9_9TELE|nr:hypothetical protein EYF80_039991 [Liparis tanakae]